MGGFSSVCRITQVKMCWLGMAEAVMFWRCMDSIDHKRMPEYVAHLHTHTHKYPKPGQITINCRNFSPYVVDTKHIISFSLRDSRLDCAVFRAASKRKINGTTQTHIPIYLNLYTTYTTKSFYKCRHNM